MLSAWINPIHTFKTDLPLAQLLHKLNRTVLSLDDTAIIHGSRNKDQFDILFYCL